ncbi:unnamed protein product, partial [Discosporangium mesarthrocarpum]
GKGGTAVGGGEVAAAGVTPQLQLGALSFFLRAVWHWPLLSAALMRECSTWDLLFSDGFIGGGWDLVGGVVPRARGTPGAEAMPATPTRATQDVAHIMGFPGSSTETGDLTAKGTETCAPAGHATVAEVAGVGSGSVASSALCWAMVHDAVLQLLEAVSIVQALSSSLPSLPPLDGEGSLGTEMTGSEGDLCRGGGE